MADIKILNIGGTDYDLKDATARSDISDIQQDLTDLSDVVDTKIDATAIAGFKNILFAGSEPSDSIGSDGDICMVVPGYISAGVIDVNPLG